MVKNILAIIAGYIAMALIIAISFTLAYNLMGADGAFKPGTYEVSATWIAMSIVMSILAALAGGYISMLLARNYRVSIGLAALVFILGMFTAIHHTTREDTRPVERQAEVSNTLAMMNAREPTWVSFLNPIIGALGVLAGARLPKNGPS
ncbi:MAG: hypothetical protein Q9P14_02910 [candidate division KSB1 bacterium]|nr:hypothetical protein [candidate division KSB1 bacterium]MDQ7063653.1 hypothetical protein [candidate division KSB1 bacterium]